MRLSKSLCATIGDVLVGSSHATLEMLFRTAGAPGDPPDLSHGSKWKEWLFRAGLDPDTDSHAVLGNVIEEFMDIPPNPFSPEFDEWEEKRARVEAALEENGLRYFRFGRILPQGQGPQAVDPHRARLESTAPARPDNVEELLSVLLRGLRHAMHPLTHRRKGAQQLTFSSEYDVQDLLHALLRPWVGDIRPEEFTPSYAGSSTRMDFLLPAHGLRRTGSNLETRIRACGVGRKWPDVLDTGARVLSANNARGLPSAWLRTYL